MPLRDNSPCVARDGLNIRDCNPLSPPGFFDRLQRYPGHAGVSSLFILAEWLLLHKGAGLHLLDVGVVLILYLRRYQVAYRAGGKSAVLEGAVNDVAAAACRPQQPPCRSATMAELSVTWEHMMHSFWPSRSAGCADVEYLYAAPVAALYIVDGLDVRRSQRRKRRRRTRRLPGQSWLCGELVALGRWRRRSWSIRDIQSSCTVLPAFSADVGGGLLR